MRTLSLNSSTVIKLTNDTTSRFKKSLLIEVIFLLENNVGLFSYSDIEHAKMTKAQIGIYLEVRPHKINIKILVLICKFSKSSSLPTHMWGKNLNAL